MIFSGILLVITGGGCSSCRVLSVIIRIFICKICGISFGWCWFGIEWARGGPGRRGSLLDCPASAIFGELTFSVWAGSTAPFCGSL